MEFVDALTALPPKWTCVCDDRDRYAALTCPRYLPER